MPSHYEVLGIGAGASDAEIRHAYRQLVKAAHPDTAGDAARFRRITEAYDVLSDPAQRTAYDRTLGLPVEKAPAPPPARRRRPARRIAVLLVPLALVAGAIALGVGTTELSLGDDCLVGTWRGEAFEIPVGASLDGREVSASMRGGAGVVVTVAADGKVRSDYTAAEPLTGATAAFRVEGSYAGATTERWQASGGRLTLRSTDTSELRFRLLINGRAPDGPVTLTALNREYPYACTRAALDVGPYRYSRLA